MRLSDLMPVMPYPAFSITRYEAVATEINLRVKEAQDVSLNKSKLFEVGAGDSNTAFAGSAGSSATAETAIVSRSQSNVGSASLSPGQTMPSPVIMPNTTPPKQLNVFL